MALTPLTGVTPDVGSSFSLLIDSTAGAAVVNLSSVTGASAANINSASQKIAYRLNPSCTGPDCKLTIALQTGGPAGSDDPLFLILRGVDSNNFYMLAVYQLAKVGADFSICKVQAGVASILATAGTDVGVAGSETIAFQITGSTLTGYVNGVSRSRPRTAPSPRPASAPMGSAHPELGRRHRAGMVVQVDPARGGAAGERDGRLLHRHPDLRLRRWHGPAHGLQLQQRPGAVMERRHLLDDGFGWHDTGASGVGSALMLKRWRLGQGTRRFTFVGPLDPMRLALLVCSLCRRLFSS